MAEEKELKEEPRQEAAEKGPEEAAGKESPPEEARAEEATVKGALSEEKKVELPEKEYTALKRKAEERDDYLDILLRTRADFQNYQKRVKRDLETLGRYANQDLVKALLPVLDNFSRAIGSVEKINSRALEKFLHGVELIQNQLLKTLEGFGVRPIHAASGEIFDHELHEAVVEEENKELPHHTILEEIEPGFIIHDRVLKPARVKVSRRPAPEVETRPGEEVPAEEGAAETHVEAPKEKVQEEPEAQQET